MEKNFELNNLNHLIQTKRNELNRLLKERSAHLNMNALSQPDILQISMELDKLLVEHQRLQYV